MKHKTSNRGDIRRGHKAVVWDNSKGNRFERKALGYLIKNFLLKEELEKETNENKGDLG